jgi:hypothetical protein
LHRRMPCANMPKADRCKHGKLMDSNDDICGTCAMRLLLEWPRRLSLRSGARAREAGSHVLQSLSIRGANFLG